MPVSAETLAELSLSEAEYEAVVERLNGREPNEVELGMFGILWSEHCGYKHSRLLLRQFPLLGLFFGQVDVPYLEEPETLAPGDTQV